MDPTHLNALVAKLQAQDASLDPRNQPTPRGQDEVLARKQVLARLIFALRNGPDDIAAPTAALVDLAARKQLVLDKQASIEAEIAAAPDWLLIRDGREQDKEYDRQQHLKRQLQHLANGTLFASPGVRYERLDVLDMWIAEQTERRDRAQRALDGYVAQAEQLLGATVPG